MAGSPSEGLTVLRGLLEGFGHEEQNLLTVEAFRLMGDLKLAQVERQERELATDAAEVEGYYQVALQIARKDNVPMLELRVAMRLYDLWQWQGKAD
jgi:hypothetical protein